MVTEENVRAQKAAAPDGGWGWLVVLASFLLQALTIGITYTFGVIFVDLLDYFKQSQSATAWIGSIQPALLYSTGILARPLLRRFEWRTLTIVGSVLSAVGFCSSALAPNVYMLYFTYGVLTGIGNGLMYVTSMVAVQHYFDKRRAMATGLAVSGSGVGTLTFGLVTQELLEKLGWQWTLVVQGGIMLSGIICGLLFRPLPHSVVVEENALDVNRNITRQPETESVATCCGRSCGCLSEVFDVSLFKNPVFSLFCFSFLVFCFGYHMPYTYTPERARQLGISPESSSFLVSIMGISNVGSRLLFGWVADRNPWLRFYIGGAVLLLGGIISILIFLFTTYTLLVVYSVLFGAFTGCYVSLFPVLLVDLLGIGDLDRSLGQCLAVGSIGFLLASPLSGLIIEGTGYNYDAPFLVMGGLETLGGVVYFFIKCAQRRTRRDYEPIPEGENIAPPRRRLMSQSFT